MARFTGLGRRVRPFARSRLPGGLLACGLLAAGPLAWGLLGGGLLAAGLTGCGEETAPTADPGEDAAVVLPDAEVAPEVDAGPPPCPPSSALSETCEETWEAAPVYVIATLAFAQIAADNTTVGFDLDDRVSTGSDAPSCNQADYTDIDGREGLDNQLGVLWPTIVQLTGDAIDGLIQGAINEGKLLITLGIDPATEGGAARLGVRKTAGAPLLDTTATLLAWQTFGLDPTAEPALADGRWLTEGPDAGAYEAGPVDVALPVSILDFELVLVVRDARFRLRPRPDGGMDGVLAGGLPIDDFMDEIDRAAVPEGLRSLVRNLLNTRADLYPDAEGRCQSLSTSLAFRAIPAFVAR